MSNFPSTIITVLSWRSKISKRLLIHNFYLLPPERDQAVFLEHPEMSIDRFTVDPQYAGQIPMGDEFENVDSDISAEIESWQRSRSDNGEVVTK